MGMADRASAVIVILFLFVGLPSCAQHRGSVSHTVTTRPAEDVDAVLHNPGMGWVIYENYPLDPAPNGSSTMLACPGERFETVDAAAVMFAWSDVETAEGTYDFSK